MLIKLLYFWFDQCRKFSASITIHCSCDIADSSLSHSSNKTAHVDKSRVRSFVVVVAIASPPTVDCCCNCKEFKLESKDVISELLSLNCTELFEVWGVAEVDDPGYVMK